MLDELVTYLSTRDIDSGKDRTRLYEDLQGLVMDGNDRSRLYSNLQRILIPSEEISSNKIFIERNDNFSEKERNSIYLINKIPIQESSNFGNKKINNLEEIISYDINKNNNFEIINQDYKIGLNKFFNFNLENSNSKKEIKFSDKNIDSLLQTYTSRGFGIKESNYSPNEGIIFRPDKKIRDQQETLPDATVVPDQVTMPAVYAPLLQALQSEFPGIKYKGITTLADKSQHEVDILIFEYVVNGQVKQLNVVAKDDMTKERMIPQFLNDIGIVSHMIYNRTSRLIMQHVGQHDLRELIASSSQPDVIRIVDIALNKIAQIHVLATQNLGTLKHEYGIDLERTDYVKEFERRFIGPVSPIISPQLHRLIQAYSSFTHGFNPGYFVHGDFHPGNVRVGKQECYVIDYEWAKIGLVFDDLSRFVNTVARDRPDFDTKDFVEHVVRQYTAAHNEIARKPIPNDQAVATSFQYAMINDELYKVGEYIAFAEAHPKVAEEKLMKSSTCLLRTLNMIDDAISDSEKTFNSKSRDLLSELKHSILDYVRISPYEQLREVASMYQPTIHSTFMAR
ncbi:MAG: phosphotransferase [Candidatus Woesearchaeota archaeon]